MPEKVKVVSVETMRKSDAWTIANKIPSKELMRRAGEGIFAAGKWPAPVGIVCGKGNNAGDGFVAAACMAGAGIDCGIILLSEDFSEDGRYYYDIAMALGIPSVKWEKIGPEGLKKYNSILDCIFGTGFSGEPREPYKSAIEVINGSGAYVVSADINSGLNGDTGLGETFVRSDLTVSIGDFKPGHFKGLAKEAMKSRVNIDIGIEIIGGYEYIEI